MATATSERTAFVAAIASEPDDDLARLAYADWLDEHGDGADRAHAELIRVQCELVGLVAHHDSQRPMRPYSGRIGRLHDRESELLGSLPDLFAPCPVCANPGPLFQTYHDCKTGRCVGEVRRGFLAAVEVPTLATCLEQRRDASEQSTEWVPTDWARALVRDFPTVRSVTPNDKRALRRVHAGEGEEWGWAVVTGTEPYDIPQSLFDQLEGGRSWSLNWRVYDTEAAARDALAVALCAVLKRLAVNGR